MGARVWVLLLCLQGPGSLHPPPDPGRFLIPVPAGFCLTQQNANKAGMERRFLLDLWAHLRLQPPRRYPRGVPHPTPDEGPGSRPRMGPVGLAPRQPRDPRAPWRSQHLQRSVSSSFFMSAFGSDRPGSEQASSGDSGSRPECGSVSVGSAGRTSPGPSPELCLRPAARSLLLLLVFGSESKTSVLPSKQEFSGL